MTPARTAADRPAAAQACPWPVSGNPSPCSVFLFSGRSGLLLAEPAEKIALCVRQRTERAGHPA